MSRKQNIKKLADKEPNSYNVFFHWSSGFSFKPFDIKEANTKYWYCMLDAETVEDAENLLYDILDKKGIASFLKMVSFRIDHDYWRF